MLQNNITHQVSKHLEEPEVSHNNLADVINWLKMGDIVMLHSNLQNGQVYHKNCKENKESFDNKRLIWVNVSSMPSLLLEGEWP